MSDFGHQENIPSMTLRQLARLSCLLDCKPSRPVTPLQILETIDWNSGRSSSELQESRFLLCIPGPNALPEMLNNLVGLGVSTVVSVFLPIVNVDISDTTNEEFELALIEDVDQICRNELIESRHESCKLFFDSLLNAPFGDETVFVSMSFLFESGMKTYSTYSFLLSFVTSMF